MLRSSPLFRHLALVGVLVAIAAAGLGFIVLDPAGLLNRYSDLIPEGLGTQTVLHQVWQAHHRVPLWRDDVLGGAPALTNTQSLYTHPLHILFALFPPAQVVGLVMWLQVLIAALGAYYAGSVMRLSPPARLMVAVGMLFSFKTILAVYAGWLAVLASVAAVPLLFATVAALLERPSLRSTLVAGAAGALALHGGHLEITYYALLFLVLWAVVRIAGLLFRREYQAAAATAGLLALSGAVAAGLSAYLLVPLALEAGLITRGATDYAFFAGTPLPVRGLVTLFGPEILGTPLDGSFPEAWEYVVYFGAVPSILALVAVVRGRTRPVVRLLVAGLILSLAFAVNTPLLKVLYTFVPGYRLFRLPARVLFLSPFFACCLAGVGLDEVLATVRSRRTGMAIAAALVALVALEGTVWARRYLPASDPIPFALKAPFVDALDRGGQPARVLPLFRPTLNYGSAAPLGLQVITGYDGFNLRHYQTYIDLLQYGRSLGERATVWTDVQKVTRLDMLGALNVLYLVSPIHLDIPASEYALVASFSQQPRFTFYEGMSYGPAYVYRNQRFLARAFFASEVRAVRDEDAVLREIQRVDLRDTALVVADRAGPSPPATGDRVDILRAGDGALDLATHSRDRRFLIISEVWHPGWRAVVDGAATSIDRADVALQGLWLPPGDHRVALRFWPPGLTIGLALTGATVLSVVALLVLLLARRPS